MSTTTTLFGSAEAQATRTLIGGTTLGDTRNELLKQILVATANKTGGSSSVAFADITGAPTDNAALAAALAAKLDLAGGTMTGALVNSTNGAASTPPLSLTGTVFTGGSSTTTKPSLLVEPAGTTSNNWSTSGTLIGGNAPSGFVGALLDMQVNGVRKAGINADGIIGRSDQGHGFFVDAAGASRLGQNQLANTGPFIGTTNNWLLGAVIGTGYGESSLGLSANAGITSPDAILARRAADHIGLGTSSATPAAQTFGGCQGVGINITGGALNIGTRGTGTGTGGVINFQSHAAGSSGATLGTLINVLSIIAPGVIRITGIPTSSAGLSSGDVYSNAGILTIVS